jgi:hypothetical protein
MQFECDICNIYFKSKAYLDKHVANSKLHAKRSVSDLCHVCTCGKKYSHRQSLHLHKKTCTFDQDENESQLQKINQLEHQIEQLLLAQNHPLQQNNTTNNIGTQNNNVHITVNAFGNENVDYITNQVCLQIVNQVFNSVPTAAQIVFFNPEHPENHNIKIPNKKEPYAMVMIANQKWEMMDRKKAIAKMTQKSYHVVEESFEKVQDQMSSMKKKHFQHFCEKMEEEDHVLLKELNNELEMKVLSATRGPDI